MYEIHTCTSVESRPRERAAVFRNYCCESQILRASLQWSSAVWVVYAQPIILQYCIYVFVARADFQRSSECQYLRVSVISAFATPVHATSTRSFQLLVLQVLTTRSTHSFQLLVLRDSRVLGHISFWYSRYPRVFGHLSFSCSRYSRLLKSFQRLVLQVLASTRSCQLLVLE